MKKIIILFLLMLPPTTIAFDMPMVKKERIKYPQKTADFRLALSSLLEHEGYYVNHPDDHGEETYSGITRVYNPQWYGWRYIDERKIISGEMDTNTHLEQLDFWVMDYYLDIWVKEKFYLIRDQTIASYVLDFRVNGSGTGITQKVLVEMGQKNVKVTNIMDSVTMCAINSVNKQKFLSKLSNRRMAFYANIVRKDKSQEKFLGHWMKRAKNIYPKSV